MYWTYLTILQLQFVCTGKLREQVLHTSLYCRRCNSFVQVSCESRRGGYGGCGVNWLQFVCTGKLRETTGREDPCSDQLQFVCTGKLRVVTNLKIILLAKLQFVCTGKLRVFICCCHKTWWAVAIRLYR